MATAAAALKRELQKGQVRSLYRRSLKNTLSWAIHRPIFYEEADKLRQRFDAHKEEANVAMIDRLILNGEEELARNIHPDPYLIPWVYGGSKYARNPPLPHDIHIVLDYGRDK